MKRIQALLIILCFSLTSIGSFAFAVEKTIYVNPLCGDQSYTGQDSNCDAPSGTGPVMTIEQALSIASSGDTIILADGAYPALGNSGILLNTADVTIVSESGPASCIINCDANFAFDFTQNNASTIDGITFFNAVTSAVRIDASKPTIINCIFTNNNSITDGGAILCTNSGRPVIDNCIFSSNQALTSGGAIFCGQQSLAQITNCTFNSNTSHGNPNENAISGGAIACVDASAMISACTFTSNNACYGGAIGCVNAAPVISDCIINSNLASEDGGAIYCKVSSPSITNCTINSNDAGNGDGGAICMIESSSPTLNNCDIGSNTADRGGAIYMRSSSPSIIDCDIAQNSASSGGGIFATEASSDISFSQINVNASTTNGGGIICYSSTLSINQTQLSSNYAFGVQSTELLGGGIYANNSSVSIALSTITANYSIGGGGVAIVGLSTANIIDSDIVGNTAEYAGAIFAMDDCSLSLNRCSINSNQATQDSGGIIVSFSDLTISNTVLAANKVLTCDSKYSSASALICSESIGLIENCTISDNNYNCGTASDVPVIAFRNMTGPAILRNSIIWNEDSDEEIVLENSLLMASYSDIQMLNVGEKYAGIGNINVDPIFAAPGVKDDNGTPGVPEDDVYIPGDYHLSSSAGRFDVPLQNWVYTDTVTSPCVDAAAPGDSVKNEQMPHGDRRNIGAYGGTEQASKSAFCAAPVPGDSNGDCKVDMHDFAIMASNWMVCNIVPVSDCWQ